ncbi:MAG: hypothetical protein U9P72_10685 [Campylobacterota bacterium]|nr:hypothetical protein [Campylobacterota bacterium]
MEEKVTYKQIADYLEKSEQTIKGWKSRSPNLLEVVKIGIFCKRHNLDIKTITKLSELQDIIKNKNN